MRNKLYEFLNKLPNILNKKIYVWGTGNTLDLYRNGLKRMNDINIIAFVDNNIEKHDKFIDNIRIISPTEISYDDNIAILICSGQNSVCKQIIEQVKGVNSSALCIHIDAAIFSLYKNEIMDVFDSLDDEKSRYLFYEILRKRSLCLEFDESTFTPNQYFAIPEFSRRNSSETFIDCGAFVGGTIEQFIYNRCGVFKKIIAFEPDKDNYIAMECRIKRLKAEWGIREQSINMHLCAVGEKNTELSVQRIGNGLGSRVFTQKGLNDELIKSVSLDNVINEKDFFIKADIEGFEYSMLKGAANAIKRYKPKMAICIYHNALDLFQIPLYIKRINSDYKLVLRHHSYSSDETVLYAY